MLTENIFIITVVLVPMTISWTEKLTFMDSAAACLKTNYVNDDKRVRVEWNGEQLYPTCNLTFHGFDPNNIYRKYKVCVRVTSWFIDKSRAILKYYSGGRYQYYTNVKVYTNGLTLSPMTEWCSYAKDFVDVELTITSLYGSRRNSITLEVMAMRMYKLEFNDCVPVQYVDNHKSFQLEWHGRDIDSRDRVTFKGYDEDNILDKYKVCLLATEWTISNPDVKLKYYSDRKVIQDILKKVYTGDSLVAPTTMWCSEPDEYVDIELITLPGGSNQGRIRLEVTAVMTYNAFEAYVFAISGLTGGVATIGFIGLLVCVICCGRRKQNVGTVIQTQTTCSNELSVGEQYGLQHMTGYNSTQATTYSPPFYYRLANTSTEQNTQDPPVIPPSYIEPSIMEHKPVLHPPRQEKDQTC